MEARGTIDAILHNILKDCGHRTVATSDGKQCKYTRAQVCANTTIKRGCLWPSKKATCILRASMHNEATFRFCGFKCSDDRLLRPFAYVTRKSAPKLGCSTCHPCSI